MYHDVVMFFFNINHLENLSFPPIINKSVAFFIWSRPGAYSIKSIGLNPKIFWVTVLHLKPRLNP